MHFRKNFGAKIAIDPRGSNSDTPHLDLRFEGGRGVFGGRVGGGWNQMLKFHIALSLASGRVRSSSLSMI